MAPPRNAICRAAFIPLFAACASQIGPDGNIHADVTSCTGKNGADGKSDGGGDIQCRGYDNSRTAPTIPIAEYWRF